MYLSLLWSLRYQISIVVLTVSTIAATAAWRHEADAKKLLVAGWKLKEAKNEIRVREAEARNYEEVIKAVNRQIREQRKLEVDIASANDANDELRELIDKINGDLHKQTTEARVQYAREVGIVLKECTSEYIALAEQADKLYIESRRGKR